MCVCVCVYVCVCVCVYYSVQLNRSWEEFHQDKKTVNSEHLNFPGKELNVTVNFFSCFLILSKTHNRMEINL